MRLLRPILALAGLVAFHCASSPEDPDGPIPQPPDTSASPTTAVTTFAVDTILLGDTDRSGTTDAQAWMEYGYDLDRHVTNGASTDVCTLAPETPAAIQIDGDEGTDNAAGAVLLPLLSFWMPLEHPSTAATAAILQGTATLEIEVTGLSTDTAQSATGLSAQVFVGAPLGAAPAFGPDLQWPVAPSSLSDHATLASGALAQLPTVYVTNGTVVATGATQPIVIPLVFDGKPLVLRIHHPIVTFVPTSSGATDGVIAGVLQADEVAAAARAYVALTYVSDCGPNWDAYAAAIAEAQDILSDGTNAPGILCDAISIGIGFTAKRIANPTQVGADLSIPDPCGAADAGAD